MMANCKIVSMNRIRLANSAGKTVPLLRTFVKIKNGGANKPFPRQIYLKS